MLEASSSCVGIESKRSRVEISNDTPQTTMQQEESQPLSSVLSLDGARSVLSLLASRSIREPSKRKQIMNIASRPSWRSICFIGLIMLITSSYTVAKEHHLRHIETRQNRVDTQNSWNHYGNRRRAEEEGDDNNDEDSANSGAANNKVSQIEQNIKQEFLYMFDNPPSEWKMEQWCVFAGMALLAVIIILWWFMACVIPTCCPKPKPMPNYLPEDEAVDSYELYSSNSTTSNFTESESEEESNRKYKEQKRPYKNSSDRDKRQLLVKYTDGKNGKPPTFAC